MKIVSFVCALAALSCLDATPVLAQASAPAADGMPPMVFIYREAVKPGKAAAHAANEVAWAAAAATHKSGINYLAMTSMTGPSEAWYISRVQSMKDWQTRRAADAANAEWTAADEKFSAIDGDLVSAGSGILARYRPGMSYKPWSNLAGHRFMMVDVYRIKPGHEAAFADAWRMQVEAHTKASMDESWAFYQVDSGMPVGTFLYFSPIKSMEDADNAGPAHGAAAFRDAVGESGRQRMREMAQQTIELQNRLYFQFQPNQSYVSQVYLDADAAYWAPKPPPAAAVKKGEKKK